MKLQPLPLLFTIAAISAPAALGESKTFPVSDFSKIEARAGVDVMVATDGVTSVSVDQADGDFSDILIENDGDTLIVSRKSLEDQRGWNRGVSVNRKNGKTVTKINGKIRPAYTVTIRTPSVSGLTVSSSALIEASGLTSDELDVSASSSGDMRLAGTSGKTDIAVSSSGSIIADDLRTAGLKIDASSSGEVTVSSDSGDIDIEASSSSDVHVNAPTAGRVTLRASSSSDVALGGTCTDLEIKSSSSADIEASDLICQTVSVTASSSADASVHATSSLIARASSGGDVHVYGNPASRDATESSGGDVSYTN